MLRILNPSSQEKFMRNSTTWRVALTVALVASLAACSSNKRGAEKAVRESLKDPDSAKFGAFDYDEKYKRGCLTVNAKNSMGGYTGDQQAYVKRTDKGWEVVGMAEITPDMCRDIHIVRK